MKTFGKFTAHIIQYVAGVLCALLCAEMLSNGVNFTVYLATTLILVCIGFTVSCILHELGHLIFGLFTGYEFISFRIGNFMIMQSNKKPKFVHYKFCGFVGQCLMSPPCGEKIPYVMYNFGGAILNLIFGITVLLISKTNIMLTVFGICSTALALSNGIPLHIGNIDNDGMNALSVSRDLEAARSFVFQLRVAKEQANGKRLSDMPDEWFEMPNTEKINSNALTAAHAINIAERKLDCGDIVGAQDNITNILRSNALSDIHRISLKLDLAYCLYILERKDEADEILSQKEVKRFMSAMREQPAVIRTRYVFEKNSNCKNTEEIYNEFEKAARGYPYKGEIESERELMRLADKR